MLKDVVTVETLEPYRLRLMVEDGVTDEVDLTQLIFESMFALLRDPASSRAVQAELEARAVVLPNRADLDPNLLFAEITGIPVTDHLARRQASESLPG